VSPRRDPVRLLGRQAGYTDSVGRALRSGVEIEAEAVDAATQDRYSLAARRDQTQARTLTRAALADAPLHVRIERCQAQAKHLGIDIYQPVRLARLAIVGGRSLAHVSRRIEAIERLCFGDLPDR
jgi:uncharacterized membrane protein